LEVGKSRKSEVERSQKKSEEVGRSRKLIFSEKLKVGRSWKSEKLGNRKLEVEVRERRKKSEEVISRKKSKEVGSRKSEPKEVG